MGNRVVQLTCEDLALVEPNPVELLGADDALEHGFIWNAVNFRYRTGWDARFPYHSTTAGTGFTYRIKSDFAIYSRVFAVFDTNYRFAGTGIGLGLRTFF